MPSLLNEDLQRFNHQAEQPLLPDQIRRGGAWKRHVELGLVGPLPTAFVSIALAQQTEFEGGKKRTEVIRLPLDRAKTEELRDYLTALLKTRRTA